jgi:hypothetical protein
VLLRARLVLVVLQDALVVPYAACQQHLVAMALQVLRVVPEQVCASATASKPVHGAHL